MQITLNQDEIHTAVEQYVRSQINIAPNQSISIDFTAGRGQNGLSATLDIRQTAAPATGKQTTRSSADKPAPAPSKPTEVKEETAEEPEVEAQDEEPDDPAPKPVGKKNSVFSKSESDDSNVEDEQEEAEQPSGNKPKSIFSKSA